MTQISDHLHFSKPLYNFREKWIQNSMVAHTLDTSNRRSSGFSWLSILQIPVQGTFLDSTKPFLSSMVL